MLYKLGLEGDNTCSLYILYTPFVPREYKQIKLWTPDTQSLFFIGSKLIFFIALLLKKWDPETSMN